MRSVQSDGAFWSFDCVASRLCALADTDTRWSRSSHGRHQYNTIHNTAFKLTSATEQSTCIYLKARRARPCASQSTSRV